MHVTRCTRCDADVEREHVDAGRRLAFCIVCEDSFELEATHAEALACAFEACSIPAPWGHSVEIHLAERAHVSQKDGGYRHAPDARTAPKLVLTVRTPKATLVIADGQLVHGKRRLPVETITAIRVRVESPAWWNDAAEVFIELKDRVTVHVARTRGDIARYLQDVLLKALEHARTS